MDIQLFATDEELQDFPENKTDSSTVQDKTPNTKSINLVVSDLPRSHADLPKISSKLPERKSKHRSRKSHRHQSHCKNPIGGQQANTAKNSVVDHQAVMSKYPIVSRQLVQAKIPIVDRLGSQTNDQLDTKQEIQWVGKPIRETYLDQLVGPSEAALPGQPALSSPEIAPPVARQPVVASPYSICLWSVRQWPVSSHSASPYSVSPWSISLVITFPRCCPFISSLTWTHSLKPSHPRHFGTSSSVSRSARTY